MNIIDQLVEKLGGWNKLNAEEQIAYSEHLKIIEGKAITIENTREFVRQMITNIEKVLVDTKENSHESRNLKARLKNFLVMESFLYSSERAKKALEAFYKTNPIL